MDIRIGTRDARGRVLQEGDEIIIAVAGPIYFRIQKITPATDPKLPPDMLLLEIAAVVPFMAKRGAVNAEFVRVRTREEIEPPSVDPGGSER